MAADRIIAIGFTMGGSSSAYFGAEPWVGSKTETSSPMFPEAAKPSPPINPAKASERMSPNRFEATMTLYSSGFLFSHINCASMFVDQSAMPGYSLAMRLPVSRNMPSVARTTLALWMTVTLG